MEIIKCRLFVGIVQIFFCITVSMNCISNVSPQTIAMTGKPSFTCNLRPWWYFDKFHIVRGDSKFHKPRCPPGYFILSGMAACHRWLNSSDLNSIDLKELIGYGAVKAVYRAKWNGINIAYSVLNNVKFKDDFLHGISMLKMLSPSPVIVQLIGYSENEYVILTEYHQLGNAVNITNLLKQTRNDNVLLRLELCRNYASLLEYLHNGPAGTRVFCDSNDLDKLLSQLLVTDNMSLLLSDLDALPEVNIYNNFSIKCGHREISSLFVAPEQRWPHQGTFDNHRMVGYNEKTDIWKAAAVCEHFSGNEIGSDVAHYHLFYLHESCRHLDSTKRPTAAHLVSEYSEIIAELGKSRPDSEQ